MWVDHASWANGCYGVVDIVNRKRKLPFISESAANYHRGRRGFSQSTRGTSNLLNYFKF